MTYGKTIGIGISTYNRADYLVACVDRVMGLTGTPFELVVANDGSIDGTSDYLKGAGIREIKGRNHGNAWNLNRLLVYFHRYTDHDPIILLEDDVRPYDPGWERAWIEAARIWGHVNYSYVAPEGIISGSGTPEDPHRVLDFGSQVVCTRRDGLDRVGYVSALFSGYNAGHYDWTRRMGQFYREKWGPWENGAPAIRHGVGALWEETTFDARQDAAGRVILKTLEGANLFCLPFCTKEDAAEFGGEIAAALEWKAPA